MTQTFSDEDLTAYLDNQMPAPERALLEEALTRDPVLKARLAALDVPTDKIAAAFGAILEAAPRPDLPPAPRAGPRLGWPTIAIAAAALVGIAIGALWTPFMRQAPQTDWKMAVANYQALYVPATLSAPSNAAPASAELAALSQALGRNLSAAAEIAPLQFRRAQMLGIGGAPLVQIAYQSATGTPFALCITPQDAAPYAPKAEVLAGLAAAHWVADGYGYVVIGGADLEFVRKVSAELLGKI